jgi:HEAT repeat protein
MTDLALLPALSDREWSVVEMAAWSIGEHETADDDTLQRLIHLATHHEESLVREAAVAALGAVGDPRGLPAIIAATTDRAPVRRRAAVALAPFDEPEAEAALRTLLSDRDWQTRQIAEDLLDERPSASDS